MSSEPDDVPAAVQTQRERLKLARRERANDMRAVMLTAAGRRFVWRYLNECGVFGASYQPGDALATAFNEGRRAAALALQKDLQRLAAPEYVRMMNEACSAVELNAELMPEE